MSAFSNCQCDYRGGLVRFGVCVSLRRSRRENRVGGEVWGARAYRAAKRCGSVGMFYVRITPAVCRIAPNRTACAVFRSYSDVGRDRHSRALAVLARLSVLAGSFRVCAFLYGDLDGVTGVRGRGNGERGWRRGLCAFLRSRIGIVSFSAGRTLGLRAPDCAKESSTLWTLFTLRRGYVGAHSRRRHPGTRKDPPGSNLWPGGSCCIAMLSTRTIVQTRAAPKRRGVGLRARSGVEAALRLAGQVVLHCAAASGSRTAVRTRCGRWRIRCSTGR